MILEEAPAKVNLALHLRRRRDDGYHELETLFAFAVDGDEVTIEAADEPSFAITGPFADALAGEGDNLVLRAHALFEQEFGATPPLRITLDKRLPVASGIGGGSADAAATLRALARMTGVPVQMLSDVALALGSDVPACLLGRTARGGGRGEMLEAVAGSLDVPMLLVNPGVALSTRDVFARWDGIDRGALPLGDPLAIARAGRNDLEEPARGILPVIGDVLDALRTGTLSRMSGSGATCFALFETAEQRAATAAQIRAAHPEWWCLETALA